MICQECGSVSNVGIGFCSEECQRIYKAREIGKGQNPLDMKSYPVFPPLSYGDSFRGESGCGWEIFLIPIFAAIFVVTGLLSVKFVEWVYFKLW